MLIVGAFALVGLGFNTPQPVIYLLVALAGAASIGCSLLLYSYVTQYYPLAVRSTGLGWASGIGRVGAIVIGVLLGMELPHKLNFIAVAIPAVLAAIAVSFIRLNSAEEAVKTQVKVSSSIKASSEAKF